MTAFLPPQAIRVDKTSGAGEDSDPLAMSLPGDDGVALGVFDGLGGAGARMFTDANGRSRSTAAIASELAAQVCAAVLGTFGFVGRDAPPPTPARRTDGIPREGEPQAAPAVEGADAPDPAPTGSRTGPAEAIHAAAGEVRTGQVAGHAADPRGAGLPGFDEIVLSMLEERLRHEFHRKAQVLEAEGPSRIKGTMSRRLPTTACLLVARAVAGGGLTCSAFWAGDSRAYVWTARAGLQQLTDDHVRETVDALTAVRKDPPMSNFVSPDIDTYLESNQVTLTAPCLLVCGSDGAFNYFHSPMEFEAALVTAICHSGSWAEAAPVLRDMIVQVAQDDVSLAMAAHGYSWERLVIDARNRQKALLQNLGPTIDQRDVLRKADADLAAATQARDDARRALDGATAAIWARYRRDYELHQPKSGRPLPRGAKKA